MLQPALEHLRDNLLTQNPNTFQKGYAGARQYQDGKIVIYDRAISAANPEGTYVGLSDNFGNYFYIRYNGKINIDTAEKRSTSCTELTGTAPLRVVAWVRNGDLSKLMEVVLHDIMATDFKTMSAADRETIIDPKLFFDSIELDPEQIFKDETGNEENQDVQLIKGVTLLAIDFGIQFNYKLKADACIDRDICVGCA